MTHRTANREQLNESFGLVEAAHLAFGSRTLTHDSDGRWWMVLGETRENGNAAWDLVSLDEWN